MKRFLKWAAVVVAVVLVTGFLAFLYFIPPFTSAPPESFIKPAADFGPSLDGIADPAQRALAERGKYLVSISGCTDCHVTPGPQGPEWNQFLAGGFKVVARGHGTFVSRNLTPDSETGIGRRSDEDVKRVLRSGVFHDGRVMFYRAMPWAAYSNWTDEDLHAVVVYLRHLKPIAHRIPDPIAAAPLGDPDAIEADYGGADYGVVPAGRQGATGPSPRGEPPQRATTTRSGESSGMNALASIPP